MTYELYHHGIKGMKWGVRRYQNNDGSLTAAGKQRLAKSIQKAAKGNTVDERKQLRKDVYDDLATNYKSQMRKHVEDIRAKKKIYEDLDKPENDYWDSGAAKKDSELAYKQTMDYFKKNDKAFLDTIIKKNGGKTTDLDLYHDFRKVYEGYEDLAWQKGEKKFYKEKGIDPNASWDAYENYKKACKSAAESVLGNYGKMQVSKINSWESDSSVRNIVQETLMFKDLKEFD